jgi:hypothetical protein
MEACTQQQDWMPVTSSEWPCSVVVPSTGYADLHQPLSSSLPNEPSTLHHSMSSHGRDVGCAIDRRLTYEQGVERVTRAGLLIRHVPQKTETHPSPRCLAGPYHAPPPRAFGINHLVRLLPPSQALSVSLSCSPPLPFYLAAGSIGNVSEPPARYANGSNLPLASDDIKI